VKGEDVQVMVQGVADTYDTYRTRAWDDKPRVNTLVIIGRYLDKVKLQEDFTKALTDKTS